MSVVGRTGTHGRARRAVLSSLILAAAAGSFAAPGAAGAQQPTPKSSTASGAQRATSRAVDVRWYPWVGCWQRTTDMPGAALTCFVPAEGASAVDLITVVNGTVESREHLVADGRPHPIEKDGCTGSQTVTRATTGARVYIGSTYTCAGDIHGRSSTLYAILPTGEWIDAREVESGGGRVLNITRYRDAGLPSTVPSSVRSALARHALTATTARASAGASVSESEVADALRAVDSAVVRAWLTARAQGYASGTSGGAAPPPPVQVRVYQGTPPAAPQQALERFPTARVPTCDASGCYVENPYSDYNGISYVPYPAYPTMSTGYYYESPYAFGYYPYSYPIVVYGAGGRFGFGGRGPGRGGAPMIRGLPGSRPQGPSGIHPVQPRPPGGRPPGRGRP